MQAHAIMVVIFVRNFIICRMFKWFAECWYDHSTHNQHLCWIMQLIYRINTLKTCKIHGILRKFAVFLIILRISTWWKWANKKFHRSQKNFHHGNWNFQNRKFTDQMRCWGGCFSSACSTNSLFALFRALHDLFMSFQCFILHFVFKKWLNFGLIIYSVEFFHPWFWKYFHHHITAAKLIFSKKSCT